ESWTWMTKHLDRQERAADLPNHGVNRVPGTVDPRDFIGQELEEIKDTSNGDDDRIAQHFERLIRRRQGDPVEMNGKAGGENGEVKINPGEASQTERDPEKINFLHAKIIGARR